MSLKKKKSDPKRGKKVYLAVYPTRCRSYGGEWDTSLRASDRSVWEWGHLDEECLIVEARIVRVVKRIRT